MTDTQAAPAPATASKSGWRSGLASAEIDTRMVGMILATAVIWISFNLLSDGDFLTARNLWNLSVQSTSIAIMATGMVLIIVSRNIDLSVGSLLGFLGYVMAMVQTRWIPNTFDLGLERWYTWIVALWSVCARARSSVSSRDSSSRTSRSPRSSSRSADCWSGAA